MSERSISGAEASTAVLERVLAKHQLADILPGGVLCMCGAELAALNPPFDDAAVKGEPLALAVHQLQEMEAIPRLAHSMNYWKTRAEDLLPKVLDRAELLARAVAAEARLAAFRGALQRHAIASRAASDFEAERRALDLLAVDDRAAAPSPQADENRPCTCDGASYYLADENARRKPFIVNDACEIHGKSPSPQAEPPCTCRNKLQWGHDRDCDVVRYRSGATTSASPRADEQQS